MHLKYPQSKHDIQAENMPVLKQKSFLARVLLTTTLAMTCLATTGDYQNSSTKKIDNQQQIYKNKKQPTIVPNNTHRTIKNTPTKHNPDKGSDTQIIRCNNDCYYA